MEVGHDNVLAMVQWVGDPDDRRCHLLLNVPLVLRDETGMLNDCPVLEFTEEQWDAFTDYLDEIRDQKSVFFMPHGSMNELRRAGYVADDAQ